jgi:hypothetical protein
VAVILPFKLVFIDQGNFFLFFKYLENFTRNTLDNIINYIFLADVYICFNSDYFNHEGVLVSKRITLYV